MIEVKLEKNINKVRYECIFRYNKNINLKS